MNDETTKTPGPSGPSTPAGGERAGAKKRRRRKSGKPAVLSAKAQPAPADAALPHKAKKSRRRKMSDEIAADPTAAIRDRIFEIDPAAEPNLPPILPIVEGFKGALPLKAAPAAPAPKAQAALKTPAKAEKKADRASAALMDHVLDALDHSNVPLAQEQLLDTLGAPAIEFFAAVDRLEAAGKVFVTRRGRIALPRQLGYVTGAVHLTFKACDGAFYKVLSEKCGEKLRSERDILTYLIDASYGLKQYNKIASAMDRANETGYGVVTPSLSDMKLEAPELTHKGTQYGIKLKAVAPSYHMIKVDVETEVNPIIGSEISSTELSESLKEKFENDPDGIWETNFLGKPLSELVAENMSGKTGSVPENVQVKLRKALKRVVNEQRGSILCILI